MLHIQNIRKLGGRRLFGGWIIKAVGGNPNEPHYLLDIHCMDPLGSTIDRCTISLNRIGMVLRANPMVLSAKWSPAELVYYFRYNLSLIHI